MKKILLLPGSKWQLPLAKKIKELEHSLYVVSPEEMPLCVSICDGFFRSDIFAIDDIERYAKDCGIEAVISDECDIAMPIVAELGKRLGLPTLSCEAARLFTDKFLMREFCNKNGLKSPEYKLCKDADSVVNFLNVVGKPLIIKPLDSNSSHGVFKVSSEDEIRNHFEETLSFSHSKKAIIAERFINGTEFTVDGIKTPSNHYTLAISEKKHFKHNLNIANELLFTHKNSKYDYDKLKAINDTFVMLSPLVYGFTHAEYKYENGNFYLIEIGARGGGNMISSIISQFMSGYDTYEYLINCACGTIKDEDFTIKKEYKEKASILKFFNATNGGGKVKEIKGLDYLERESSIKEYKLNFNIGDIIEDAKSDSSRIGFYIACSETIQELTNVIEQVEDKFKIIIQ